jgi:glyoxylase-like metal-dependent hydrolase (beta-lactamase superfamily II)
MAVLASLAAAAPPTQALGPDAQLTIRHGDGRVGAYISKPRGFETATYWIEGPTGLILIDTQFLLSAAEEAIDWAEKTTGKKAVLAIVLHANPDKFNGTEVFKKHGIRVVTSEPVRALIPAVHELRHRWFYDRFQPDYPDQATLPDSFGRETTELTAGGVTVKAHVMGAGCSEAHVVVQFEDHLFVGDLVSNHNHSWLEIGKTDEWRKRIGELKALQPEYVHPGRGPAGGAELLDRQEAYLKNVWELVAAEGPTLPIDDRAEKAFEKIRARLNELFPGYDYERFVEIGLPAVWERQARIKAAGSK